MLLLRKSLIYQFLIVVIAIDYLPRHYRKEQFSIEFGDISIYLIDICFLAMIFLYLFSLVKNEIIEKVNANKENNFRAFLLPFCSLYLFILIKLLIQSPLNIATIRAWLIFSAGYLFVLFVPFFIKSLNDLRRLIVTGSLFAIYIFILHFYNFSVQGYKIHILSGNFLTLLGTMYFILSTGSTLLRINLIFSYLVRILIITTYLMVGHRSGFIALIIGMLFLIFLPEKKMFFQHFLILFAFLLIILLAMSLFAPSLTSKLMDRASTTFDTQQETYQGRYYNVFKVINYSNEYPILGKPFDSNLSRFTVKVKEKKNSIVYNYKSHAIVPHNLILEWLYLFGYPGLLIGLSILMVSYKMIKKFLMKYRDQASYYRIGIGMLCAYVHNLFYALCNVTSMSVYTVFCLYFPLALLVSLEHNIISGDPAEKQAAL